MKTLKYAWKAIVRFKIYTIINLLGLTFSLACVLIIAKYIHQELTVNHFCYDIENTYLLECEYQNGERHIGSNEDRNNDPNFIDPLKTPAVIKSTRFIYFSNDNLTVDRQKYNVKTYVTDSVFLQILPHPLLSGSARLQNPNDAIITKSLANRLFGNSDPIGKHITYNTGDILTITGVIDAPKTKSSFDFDLLISSDLQKMWSRMSYSVVQLTPGSDYKRLNKQNTFMSLMAYAYFQEQIRLQFYPLNDFYFSKAIKCYDNDLAQGNSSNLIVLSIVGLSLLLVGLLNFTNIYTVVMMKRSREFGIKKVYGSAKRNIFAQIFLENIIIISISLILSWFLVEITRGIMEQLFNIPSTSDTTFSSILSITVLLILPLLISIYPYYKYTHKTAIVSIRSVNVGGKSVYSRALFLFLQYVMTFIMIIISIFFIKQVRFMLKADLNYQTHDIIQCKMLSQMTAWVGTKEEWRKKEEKEMSALQTIEYKMNTCPYFSEWTPGENPNQFSQSINIRNSKQNSFQQAILAHMDYKYMNMFGLHLKEGRLWNDSTENPENYNVIINESAKKILGIENIETDLIQTESRLWWSSNYPKEEMKKNPPYHIIGVIEDFKIGHLSKATMPLFITYGKGSLLDQLMAHISPGKKQEAITFLHKLHDEVVGEGDFEYSFLDDEIASMYEEDKRVSDIYLLFTIIAISISCMGLFGLSFFDIQQRYREIALRKVNGATLKEIYPLLLKKYGIICGTAFLISIPIAWYILTKYLEGFANKAPISWWIFVMAGFITFFVSFMTLIWQIRKAASINPAIVLKGE